MEQIATAFGVNWKLIVIQAVNFSLLLFLLHRFLYRPMLAMIDTRRAKIENAIHNAEQAEIELGEAGAEKARILREATAKGDALIDAAKKRAEAEERTMLKEAHRKAVHVLNDAERRALREHAEMLEKTEREVARMAVLATEKMLRRA